MKLSGFVALFAVLSITNALSLQTLCRTTFGRKRLGSRCNPFLPPCQVSPWSQWAQSPTKLEIDTFCRSSRSRGIQERKRTVTVPGSNCPSLCETRKANCNFRGSASCDCFSLSLSLSLAGLDSTTASAVNVLRLYAAMGSNFHKPAPGFAGPNPFLSSIKKIVKEAEKLAGCVVKRSYPQCSCPCASGNLQLHASRLRRRRRLFRKHKSNRLRQS